MMKLKFLYQYFLSPFPQILFCGIPTLRSAKE